MRPALAALALAAGLTTAGPAGAAWMHTGWEAMTISQDACLRLAEETLRKIGFQPSADRQTTFGWRNQDGVAVRCIADKQVAVLFVYSNTSSEDGQATLAALRAAFQNGGAAAQPTQPFGGPPQAGRGGSKF